MNIGLYQSAASLSALERWQDAVSQNITSSQVTGYRKRTVEFSTQALGRLAGEFRVRRRAIDRARGVPKATNGDQLPCRATRSRPAATWTSRSRANGFFEIQLPDGTHAYTRNGEFSVRADRTLVNGSGGEVLSDSGSADRPLPAAAAR